MASGGKVTNHDLVDYQASGSGRVRETYAVPALDKAVAVLELLASSADGMTLAEMVTQLSRSMGELYRLVVALERHELISKNPLNDRYTLSLRLFELSHRHPPSERLLRHAQPAMDTLVENIDQSCHLAVLYQKKVLVIASSESLLPMHYSVRVGSQFPVLEASSGMVLLAHARTSVVEAASSELASDERQALHHRLESVRQTGRERISSSVVAGIINLSVPVFNHQNHAVAALTVPFLAQRYARASVEQVEQALLATSAQLSSALGFTPATAPTESRN